MNEPDEWLMIRLANDDQSCLDPLIRRHADAILTFVTRVAGSTHLGEEIFQEVFVAVWLKRATFRYPMPFRPWLFKIAHNKCREILRKRRMPLYGDLTGADITQNEPASAAPPSPGPLETAVAQETGTIVAAAVAKLPDRQRAAVVMRLWNGMSFSEIAAALGIRPATVRTNLHHALARIRQELEPRLR
jgi:RNA polymerase sigma-70 factor (ECF subfamily)